MQIATQKMKLLSRRMPIGVRIITLESYLIIVLTAKVAQERGKAAAGTVQAFAGLHIGDSGSTQPPKPPARPALPSDGEDEESVEDDDEDNPFGDRNALQTSYIEHGAPKW